MRLILIGNRAAGKSSAGNTILGRKEFVLRRTAQCGVKQGEVAGRQVTVVDTPGWWRNCFVKNTTELDKQEIVLSVSQCPPGPHALLLVIRVDSLFTEKHGRAVEQHLELLSERIWTHTIVLFTCGDWLGDTTIEEHIWSDRGALQWLVEKCGNRYHVLNNKNRGDGTQVTELLEKIEKMMSGNGGRHCEIERQMLLDVEKRRETMKKKAQERLMKVKSYKKVQKLLMGDTHHLSELRIVMLGYKSAGKSSTGNTILGSNQFDSSRNAQCVKKQGEVAARKVNMVETPGWWINQLIENTTELDKQEIVRSVSLCPPGPHSLLLVTRLDIAFREEEKRVVQQHLELLSENVWSHTIVLFTCGDWLGDATIEQHIESEGEALQWLVEKCGNRYHVLNNRTRGNYTQVPELLEKIEEVVVGNGGHHYEMNRGISTVVEQKRKRMEDKAKRRLKAVQKRSNSFQSKKSDAPHLSELRIVLLGYRQSGKSSAGNTILAREEFYFRTGNCDVGQGEIAGRQVTVVDTPGWWANCLAKDTPKLDKEEIVDSVCLCPPGPHSILLLIRLDTSFTEHERRAVQEHLELLSKKVWSHTILLFTCGDWLGDTAVEQHIESEGEALQWLVEKCGSRYHILNNKIRGDGTQVTELLEKIEKMVAGNGGDLFHRGRLDSDSKKFWAPNMTEDDRSDTMSLEILPDIRSSGYGSCRSQLASECSDQ